MSRDWHDVLREAGADRLRESHAQIRPNGKDIAGDSLHTMSMDELLARESSPCPWVVDGILPTGGTSLLVGKPKEGKSTLARMLACDIVTGHSFLGRYSTTKGAVLYCAFEENEHHVREHFLQLVASLSGGAEREPIDMVIGGPAPDVAERFAKSLESKPYGLAIVDPLIRLITVDDINAYAAVYAALSPFVDLARRTQTHVMCVHHAGKGQRSGAEGALGSQALLGAVDTVLSLARGRGGYGVITSRQRYGTELSPTRLFLDPVSGRFQPTGREDDDDANEQVERRILDLVTGNVLTEDEIRQGAGGNQRLSARALRKLVRERRILREGGGKRNDPYRYRAADPPFRTCANNEEQKADSPPTSTRNRENRESGNGTLSDAGAPVAMPPAPSPPDPRTLAKSWATSEDGRPPTPCRTCGSISWWLQNGRAWVCGVCHPRPVRSVGTVQDEALGDDRDALADIAAKLGYPAPPADCGVSLAPGQASWSQFTEQASADELAQARAGLERIKAAAHAASFVCNRAGDQARPR
jgi:hypothetical protein